MRSTRQSRALLMKLGDADASWAWLAMGELPADVLLFWRRRRGAAFIRKWGFSTRHADAVYGPGWLDME